LGQSTVIGVAFSALIFVAGIASFITLNISSVNLVASIIPGQIEKIEAINNEKLEITDWLIENNQINVNITNTGDTKIALDDFETIDIILFYSLNESDYTIRPGWSQDQQNFSYWKLEDVYYKGQQGDTVNPIDLNLNYGFWDPYETIKISIFLEEEFDTFKSIIFTSPKGITEHKLLSKEEDYGTAKIVSGELMITVNHELNKVPSNIQITPLSNITTNYWLGNTTNFDFTIYLSDVQDNDVSFYWWANS
jgi:archaellum component FlaF (FlaF/FlaG flagellin family)